MIIDSYPAKIKRLEQEGYTFLEVTLQLWLSRVRAPE